jgi:hypothetical protein
MNWRRAVREDHQVAALWAICAGLTLAFRPLWLAAAGFLPPCLWREWTGWPCPGCGTTRAIVRLLHADVVGALASNPLAACLTVGFVAGGVVAPVWLAFGGMRPCLASDRRTAWMATIGAAFLANWSWLAVSGV